MKSINKTTDSKVLVRIEKLQDKEVLLDYEENDTAIPSPVLGGTLISTWTQDAEPEEKYYLIIDDCSYEVNKSLYENVDTGDLVRMIYSQDGKVLLSITPDAGDFRLLDKKVVVALRALRESQRYTKGLYNVVGFRKVAIDFDAAPRLHCLSSPKNNYFSLLSGW